MQNEPPKIVVDWAEVYEPTDDPRTLTQHLAAAYDEGPLIVIPAWNAVGPGRRCAEGNIFADVMSYRAHLDRYADEIRADLSKKSSAPRWTGLVRGNSTNESPHALAVIYALKMLLAPPSIKRSLSPRSKLQVTQNHLVLASLIHRAAA